MRIVATQRLLGLTARLRQCVCQRVQLAPHVSLDDTKQPAARAAPTALAVTVQLEGTVQLRRRTRRRADNVQPAGSGDPWEQ